jgi:type II secretory pathway pseudopilin PulG
MTYIELIVVLSIFAVMTAIILFNYQTFQAHIDIKNLANDIALQVVQAQNSSAAGELPPLVQQAIIANPATWKPAYGVYINPTVDNASFIYFADLNNDNLYTNVNCIGVGECLNKISITKNNVISRLDVFYQGDATAHSLTDLTVTFTRPNSAAILKSTTAFTNPVSYVQITILSPQAYASLIKIYPSGRVQIN